MAGGSHGWWSPVPEGDTRNGRLSPALPAGSPCWEGDSVTRCCICFRRVFLLEPPSLLGSTWAEWGGAWGWGLPQPWCPGWAERWWWWRWDMVVLPQGKCETPSPCGGWEGEAVGRGNQGKSRCFWCWGGWAWAGGQAGGGGRTGVGAPARRGGRNGVGGHRGSGTLSGSGGWGEAVRLCEDEHEVEADGERGQGKALREAEEESEDEQERRVSKNGSGDWGRPKGQGQRRCWKALGGRERVRPSWNGNRETGGRWCRDQSRQRCRLKRNWGKAGVGDQGKVEAEQGWRPKVGRRLRKSWGWACVWADVASGTKRLLEV